MRYYSKSTVRPSMTGYFAGFIMIAAMYIYGFGAERLQTDSIRDMMLASGCWGPSLYILCNAIRPFFLFPAIVLGVAGGLAFGPFWGTVYLIIGTALGAALCFGAARLWGYNRIKHSWPKWLPLGDLGDHAAEHSFRTVLSLRLTPVLPWDVVSVMAGLSKVQFWPYIFATVIGSIPGAIAFNYLGDSLSHFLTLASVIVIGTVTIAICVCCGKRYLHS